MSYIERTGDAAPQKFGQKSSNIKYLHLQRLFCYRKIMDIMEKNNEKQTYYIFQATSTIL